MANSPNSKLSPLKTFWAWGIRVAWVVLWFWATFMLFETVFLDPDASILEFFTDLVFALFEYGIGIYWWMESSKWLKS